MPARFDRTTAALNALAELTDDDQLNRASDMKVYLDNDSPASHADQRARIFGAIRNEVRARYEAAEGAEGDLSDIVNDMIEGMIPTDFGTLLIEFTIINAAHNADIGPYDTEIKPSAALTDAVRVAYTDGLTQLLTYLEAEADRAEEDAEDDPQD